MLRRRDAPPLDPAEMTARWRRRAACRTEDVNVFFIDQGDMDTLKQAKALCARCPVRRQCLDFAIENNERHGIWGGLSRKDRNRIRKRRSAAA